MSRKFKEQQPDRRKTVAKAATVKPAPSVREVTGICVLLVIAVFLVFGRTVHFDFVNYDDDDYVYENPSVQAGISFHSAGWAFTHVVAGHWHPLTVLTLMLDSSIYGSRAGGFHLTNVLLHSVAVVLLFLVLTEMTGALWPSAFVAALFAIHPLRVESVAWISERKDVLSGVFFMLTLGAYLRYVRRPPSLARYLLVVFCFALGLMSKPTLVTLPFVLLLLDYWPLRRFARSTPDVGSGMPAIAPTKNCATPGLKPLGLSNLLIEKIPLFALSAASCVSTILAVRTTLGWVAPDAPVSMRAANAIVSYAAYIGQMLYPAGLAVFYPFPKVLPVWEVALAALLLVSVTAGVLFCRKRKPWLFVGWLWYLGVLVPMIGLTATGGKALSDRYTYLSQIGLCLALTWAITEWRLTQSRDYRRFAHGFAAAVVIAFLILRSHAQTASWRDSQSLWIHTLGCTKDNTTAHTNLGNILVGQGRVEEGAAHFLKALQIDPGDWIARYDLGKVLYEQGQTGEAVDQFRISLQINPACAEAHYNLGVVLQLQGQTGEAIDQFREALKLNPADLLSLNNLGYALLQQGQTEEAIAQFREALRIDPNNEIARKNLDVALHRDIKSWP